MLTLTANDIRLGCTATDWQDALNQASQELQDAGRTTPDYHAGMLAREQQSSTVLGNGIAIPHGTPESRDAWALTPGPPANWPSALRPGCRGWAVSTPAL